MRRLLTGLFLIFLGVGPIQAQFTFSWSSFTTDNSDLPDDLVTSLAYDTGDTLWVGTAAGLAYITDSTVYAVTDFPNYYITSLSLDKNQNLWIGTAGNGCYQRTGTGNYTEYSVSSTSGQLSSDQILSLHCDGDSTWVGTDGEGAFLLYLGTWTQYYSGNHPFSWSVDQVYNITTDAQRRVWFCTGQSGVVRKTFTGSYWKFTKDSGLRYNFVRDIALQGDSIAWIGMGNTTGDSSLAMLQLNNSQLVHYGDTGAGTFLQQNSWDIFIDSDSRKWIASNQPVHGLLMYNDTSFSAFDEFTSGILSNRTYAIAEDDSNKIWVGSFRGLAVNQVISTLSTPEVPVLVAGAYPNPTQGLLNIQFSSSEAEIQFSVFDISGKEVYHTVRSLSPGAIENTTLDLGYLPQGMYLLKITDGFYNKVLKIIRQ